MASENLYGLSYAQLNAATDTKLEGAYMGGKGRGRSA